MRTHFPGAVHQMRAPARCPQKYSDSEERMEQMAKEVAETASAGAEKCPVAHAARRNRDWWPDALDISVLHRNSSLSDPTGEKFDYARAFESLDLNAVIKDLNALMTAPRDWWPADFGHYGG